MQVGEKLISLGNIACPIVMTGLLLYSKTIISMLFLGYLGDTELAGPHSRLGLQISQGTLSLKDWPQGWSPYVAKLMERRNGQFLVRSTGRLFVFFCLRPFQSLSCG